MYRLLPFLALQIKSTTIFPAKNPELYSELGDHIKLVQTAAILEVIHAMIGIVRSNPMVTAVQIASRLLVVWLPIHFIAESQTSPGISIMLFAWCLTEMVRYSFYAFNLVNLNVGVLTWLRYTLFIVLYPMGVCGEMWCYIDALPVLSASKALRLEMPNPYNFTFSPYVVTILILLGYAPGFPPLYFHMFALRKKVLGGGEAKKVA